jgi:hypothetical protein
MHVQPPCEQGVASTDRTWGMANGRLKAINPTEARGQQGLQ